MAELADAQDLKSCGTYTPVPVRFRSPAVRDLSESLSLFLYCENAKCFYCGKLGDSTNGRLPFIIEFFKINIENHEEGSYV